MPINLGQQKAQIKVHNFVKDKVKLLSKTQFLLQISLAPGLYIITFEG